MKKIAVLFGGNSPEYSVSLASATSVIQAIDPQTYEVLMIGLAPTMDWYLYQGNVSKCNQ
jgi:D-alanine---D-serine ligase